MANLAPIVGKYRRQITRDIVGSLSVAVVSGYAFWYLHHVPKFDQMDAYYRALKEKRDD